MTTSRLKLCIRPAAAATTILLAMSGCKIEGTEGGRVDDRDPFVVPAGPDPFIPPVPPPQTRRVVILHTNDEHSHLLGFAPNSAYPFLPQFANGTFSSEATAVSIATQLATAPDMTTTGGIVRRQFLINRERAAAAAAGDPSLLLSAGDVMMGTVFHVAYAAGQAPDFLAMAALGYDFAILGNHEFDFGADVLANAISAAHQTTFGSATPLLASNIHFDDVPPGGPGSALQELMGPGNSGAPLMPWATKTLANGLKIGFIGLVGYDAALVAPFKAPIFFSTPRDGAVCDANTPCASPLASCTGGRCVNPLDVMAHIQAMAAETQAIVNRLRNEENVDVVINITHLGQDEDEAMAALVTGVDVIIGGHSHTVLEPYKINDTIITQAGSYGRRLGKLVLTVTPDGTVDFVPGESEQFMADPSLDAQIFGDTDLASGRISPTFDRALRLTGGVVAPVIEGLNAVLAPPLGLNSLLDDVVSSDHDVVGEVEFQDHNLLHLVTDAQRAIYLSQTCHLEAGGPPVVSVQANGVIRESLRFSKTGTSSTATGAASFADVFRVLPLGASPFEGTAAGPGYPEVVFTLNAVELLAGADVGVTLGLESDAFFLSYSGMRIEYDRNRPPFDPTAANPFATGRVVKMELDNGMGGFWTLYDANAPGGPQTAFTNPAGMPVDPTATYITVVTSLYLAGFLERFGLVPRDTSGMPLPGQGLDRLAQTALCFSGMPKDCAGGTVGIFNCIAAGGPPWPAAPEVKEWQMLLAYLQQGLGGVIPSPLYRGDTVPEPLVRVRDVTP